MMKMLEPTEGHVDKNRQARIAYFHWKKQKALDGPCTDMVALHRLCATKGGEPDGLESEIPTIFTVELSQEVLASHFHFGVLNRPNSVRQLLSTPEMRSTSFLVRQ